MAVLRDTIIEGHLQVSGDATIGGLVPYVEEDKKISYPKRLSYLQTELP